MDQDELSRRTRRCGEWSAYLPRLAAVLVITGVALGALWRAGGLSNSTGDGGGDSGVGTRDADTSLPTPNATGLDIGLREGKLAPNFEVSDFQGRRVRLSDFRGQVVFLNFWATWCGPCRAEMPELQTLLDRHRDDGLAVFAVNYGEPLGLAKRWVDQLDLRFTAFGLDPGLDVIRKYSIQGMPTSYFIDANGIITKVFTGRVSLKLMEESVKDALNAPAVAAAPSD